MKLNTGIAAIGLAALLGAGCQRGNTDARVPPAPIIERVYLEKPTDCVTVRDIRREMGHHIYELQLLCEDAAGRTVLYTRQEYALPDDPIRWKRIEVR